MKYLSFFLVFFWVSSFAFSEQVPFVWADDQDYEPYIYLDSKSEVSGIFHDVMKAVFAQMKPPLTYKLYPWKRAQKLVSEASADGMITIPTQSRLKYLLASDPIVQVDMKVHFNKENKRRAKLAKVKSIAEMRPYSIIDYQGDGWAESNLAGYNVSWAPNYTSAVWMIAANRGDIFLDDPISIQYHIKKQVELTPEMRDKLMLIEHGDFSILSAPHCLLINKNSPYASLIQKFNIALKEIKANGKYDKIIRKYLN